MYITSVEISNFRSFQGYHNFEFKFKDKTNFNVIFGKNGVGKSVFVDAIYWCLYGKEILDFPTQPLYNYSSFEEIDVGEALPVIVACKFENKGEILEVRREVSFIKNPNNKSSPINPNPNLNIFIHTDDGNVEVKDMPFFDKFPEFLFSFLFYEDENSDFFEKEYSTYLKNIIYKFCMFEYIDAANFHINSLSNNYIKELKKLGPEQVYLSELLSQHDIILKNINDTNKELFEVSNKKNELILKRHKIYEVMSNHSDKIKDLVHRRLKLDDELKLLGMRINEHEIKRRKLLFKLFPSAVFLSQTEESNDLNNIINNSNLENSSFSQRYYQIKQLYNNLDHINYIKIEDRNLNELKNMCSMKIEELSEINEYFKVSDVDDICSLECEKDKIEESIFELDKKSELLKYTIDSLNKGLKHNERNMKRFKESKFSHDIVHRRISFCKDAEEFGHQLEKELFKYILSKVEDYVNHIFFHYFGMNTKFKEIILNDSFEIHIIKHSNQTISIGDLSSSEKKILRLTLIFSIYRCFKLKFPVILMDPFSKLDIDKIEGLFKFIFEEVENQIIFILNDNQDNDYLKCKFLKNNVVSYQLIVNFDNMEVISHEN